LGSLPISHRGTRDLCAKEGDTNFWQVFSNVMMMCNYRLSPDRVKIISRHSCTIIARVHSRQGRNFIYLLLINVKHFNNHNSQRKSAQLKFMNAPGRRFSLCFCIFFVISLFFLYAVNFHVAVRELFHASRCMKCNSNRGSNNYNKFVK